MIKGIDALGFLHKNYPRSLLIEMLPNNWGVGILIDPKTFGKDTDLVRQLMLARPDIKLLRLHCHWSASHNALCPVKKLKNLLSCCEHLALSFPNTQVWTSHTLEYGFPNNTPAEKQKKMVAKRLQLINDLAPTCRIVQSIQKGWSSGKYAKEAHGPKSKAPFVSTDGVDIWDMDYRGWLNRNNQAIACFGWSHSQNGREKGKPPKPYAKRDNWPDKQEFKRLIDCIK